MKTNSFRLTNIKQNFNDFKLKPLYKKSNFLNVKDVFKLGTAKFMMKLNTNELPEVVTNKFVKLVSVHSYSTRSSNFNDYFSPRSYHVKPTS